MPWHEWRQDFGMDERCDYLANLLYRGAGLTVKDASVVPGGVRMAGRTFPDGRTDDARSASASSGSTLRVGLPGTFDSEADGMSGYVRRVTADPGSDVRVNRAGSVIVEDNTFDSDAKALRDSEYVPRVYSKDKPDARAGYEDGGYDPARSKADEILRRVERSAKRQKTTTDEGHRADVARSLGLADVAPYGMTLEPGAGAAARRGEARGPRARRRAAADEDAERRERRKKPESVRNVPNRAASVRRRAPRANAAEPRAAGAADAAGPVGAIRRRRVRVSVPKAASSRFAGAPRGASAPSVSRRVLSGKGDGKDANDAHAEISSAPRRMNGETGSSDRKRPRQKRDDEEDDDAKNANTNDSSSLWSSANERSREAPVSALRGVGAKSAARLAALGVDSVGDLAALSDGAAAEKGASVRGLRDKARRALGGAWET